MRLIKGDFDNKTEYEMSPIEQARKYKDYGFKNLHIVDLDAKDGYLSVSGWNENSNQLALDYLRQVNDYGVSRIIYTDINIFLNTIKISDTTTYFNF